MGFNDFPCYLGFILPSQIHHTRVGGVDWFQYLESRSVSPAHQPISGSSDILLSTSHPCSKAKMKEVFEWLNKCLDACGPPFQFTKGLLIVLHKEDWELYKTRGFMSDLKICEERPNETKRLPSDLYCFYTPRDSLTKLTSALDSHYSMHYSFGAKCPVPNLKNDNHSHHGHGHGHNHHNHNHHSSHHHSSSHSHTHTNTTSNGELEKQIGNAAASIFNAFGITVTTSATPKPTPAPAPVPQPHHHHHHHHHPTPAPAPVPQPTQPAPYRPLPVYVDQNAPHMGFNKFDAYLGFAFATTVQHHTHVRGKDWISGIDKSLKPKLQTLPGGTAWFQKDSLVSVIHQCDRRQIGNMVNWFHEVITEKVDQYPKHLREGLVIVMIRADWKIWKSRMTHNEKSLSEKCPNHERDNLGHHYVGRFVPLANLDRFVTALANHYSNNYQVGSMAMSSRPDPHPDHKKPRRHNHNHDHGHHHHHHHHHHQGPHGHPPAPVPAPQPYNPHQAPAPQPHPYNPHQAPAPVPAPYNPHQAPAPQPHPYNPHQAPAPAPAPYGAPAPAPYGAPAPAPYGAPAPAPYGAPAPAPHGAPAPAPYGSAPPPYGGY